MGYKRAVIYDLQRKSYEFIPNYMVDFIANCEGKTKEEICKSYSNSEVDIITEYINFMEIKEFCFWVDHSFINNFQIGNYSIWDYPAAITNAIIDISDKYCLISTLKQLDKLGCKHVQLRSYQMVCFDYLNNVLLTIETSQYLSIEIIAKHNSNIKEKEIILFIKKYKRIKAIILHSSINCKIVNVTTGSINSILAYTSQQIKSPKDCHNNSNLYFRTSVPVYTEAQQYHLYYNRKVSIDSNGNIKNCNSHDKFFGNVNIDKIEDVISLPDFQKLWFVAKDKTEVCRDCEFRYMCTDSRMPKQRKNGDWYHEEECNYNPYIAKWKTEADYITIEEYKKNKTILHDS
jgi:SPASM domain peptide maturase of grasp-with-spasm system